MNKDTQLIWEAKKKREPLFSPRNIGTAAGVIAGSFLGPVGLAAGGILGRVLAGATADTFLGTPEDLIKLANEFKEGIKTGSKTLRRGHRDDSMIRKAKKINAETSPGGFLTCVNCTLQPANNAVGEEGRPYYPGMEEASATRIIEGHHYLPIKEGERKSKVWDVLCLCRNCHKLYETITR